MASASPRRKRGLRYVNRVRTGGFGFINPYPHMADAEAMVHLELEHRHIPFSWRYFDGESPWLAELLPDYAPEFTLREHKLVIIVVGSYFGTLPSVLDRTALAQAALEEDGWKVVSLYAFDIERDGAKVTLDKQVPELSRPVARGERRDSPYDPPTYFEELRERISALALRRSRFAFTDPEPNKKESSNGAQSRRARPGREPRRSRNSGRRRRRTGG